MKHLLSILFLLACISIPVSGQTIEVKGIVVSEVDNEPLPGVNISVKGNATRGTITDLDGKFIIDVPGDAVLVASYIGYTTQDIAVKSRTFIKITLKEDTESLDEVVVVGYGTQKKSVVTAAIAKVSADDIGRTAPVRVDNALKGLAAGVTVTSASGQPGAASQIRVRGIGTINNSDPLYIVDGMPIEGGIDYLNPSDIQSIEVLKDAASGAIYGARAANGVVMVTTKTGKVGKAIVTYDFSYGWQSRWKERDVLDATEYAIMMNEGAINAGMAPKYNDPYSYGKGTNWQKETFNNNAPVLSSQVSMSGASDKVNYLLSFGFFRQDGIVGGDYDRSNYKRVTLRSNTTYTVFENQSRNWLNSMKITSNLSYAQIKSKGVETNSSYGSPLGSALALSPILSVYAEGQAAQDQLDYYSTNADYTPMYSPKNGKLYTLAGSDYNEMVNPLASLSLPGDKGWSHKFVANFSAELQIWDGLKFRSSYGADLAFWGNDGYTTLFYLTANNKATRTSAYSSSSRGTVWQIENVLWYDKQLGKNFFTILLGQSAKKSSGNYLGGSRFGLIDPTGSKPYIDFCNGLQENGDMSVYGGANAHATLSSMFARVNYNYDERYMAQFTIRRDGSSRFGSNNHYAIFPSMSAGWNISNESFMEGRPDWFSTMKLRFSWGKNGNENIGNFMYTVLTAANNNYILGSGESMINGVKASGLANPDLKWEESKQYDLGLDVAFFNNALNFSIDYYKKTTDGMLMTMNIPSYVGESKPIGNVGKMQNKGVEMELNYRLNVRDWTFRFAANASYLKNKLLEYGNETGWDNLDSFQGIGTISRAQNGEPFPYFYGYKAAGVCQTMDEVNAYTYTAADGTVSLIQPNAVPGDVRFVDANGDGVINDDDRVKIGKGMPDWTFGFSLNVQWRGFDLNAMFQGTKGNQIFDATRRTDITSSNLPSWMLQRWTGEGTSNSIPRFVLGDNVNWQSSDLYVYDGSYLRLKNIQLGYTLPQRMTNKVFISMLRIYVAAENLCTWTKYHGYDPEISSGGTSLGIDRGVYPQARTISLGANLTF